MRHISKHGLQSLSVLLSMKLVNTSRITTPDQYYCVITSCKVSVVFSTGADMLLSPRCMQLVINIIYGHKC